MLSDGQGKGVGLDDSSPTLLHAEDLPVGATVEIGAYAVTLEEIIEFARQWDPLPVHVDEVAAKDSIFGGIIGSGIHSMAIFQRMATTTLYSRYAVIAGTAIREVRLTAPLRPGTTVRGAIEVLDVDLSRPTVPW